MALPDFIILYLLEADVLASYFENTTTAPIVQSQKSLTFEIMYDSNIP